MSTLIINHCYLENTPTERKSAGSQCQLQCLWIRGAYLISIPWLGSSSSWILPPSGVRRYANSSSMSISDKKFELMETNIQDKRTQLTYLLYHSGLLWLCDLLWKVLCDITMRGYWWHNWRNSHTGNCLADRSYPQPLETASRPVASRTAAAQPHDQVTGRLDCLWRHGADWTKWRNEK